MDGTPKSLEPYRQAQRVRENLQDIQNWKMGMYMLNAIGCCFSKDSKYPDKPMFQHDLEEEYLTEEEIMEREIQKAIREEELRAERFSTILNNDTGDSQ